MYKRYLNNNDYVGLITAEALSQMTRGNEECFINAEEAAEISLIEYLDDNYEIQKVLDEGKRIRPYRRQITYPVGSHFLKQEEKGNVFICVALRTINGCKAPATVVYWEELAFVDNEDEVKPYSQLESYNQGDVVSFANKYYKCLSPNGYDYNDIRIPGVKAWTEVETEEWQPNMDYPLWKAVSYNGQFYALTSLTGLDTTVNPYESDNWGKIGDYDSEYNKYELSEYEYVVYNGKVFVPEINANSDELSYGFNIQRHDPRNPNVKKHMLRLAVYELTKMISPNNVSSARITDYENSIEWLRDASRMRINPMIPRKLDEKNQPETDFAVATFMRDYDPNDNPWQI